MNKILICCFSLVLMYPLGIDLYLVGLPQIAASLGATEADLHAAFSIYLLGMASTMVVGGLLADKYGRKPVAIIGSSIFAMASWWAMGAADVTDFLFARFAQGVGAGFAYVTTFAILRDTLDDDKRAKVLSMINGITCIVPVLAPVIGYIILLMFPWTSLFLAMTVTAIIIGLSCLLFLQESLQADTGENRPFPKQHFYSAYFLKRLFIASISVTAILTYVNTSPMLMMDLMGYSVGQYSLAMALLAGVSMTSGFMTPKLLVRLGQQSVMLLSQLLFLLAALQLFVASEILFSSYQFIGGFAFICIGFSLGIGTVTSQALKPFNTHAGLASSVLGVMQVSVSAFYIWFMGWLGVTALNMLIILLLIAGVGSILLLSLADGASNETAECDINAGSTTNMTP